jgi:small ligand-binding sensory domain FIST
VVTVLAGDVTLEPVVSQGCRPIGRAGRITKAAQNRLVAVDDAPAQRFLEEQLAGLGNDDLALAEANPLYLGIGSDPFAMDAPERGDFLVRGILGVDPASGNMLVADQLNIGRHVQLHLRDAHSSEQDLELRLRRARPATAQAAVLFRCLARDGMEQQQFAAAANGVPLAGFHSSGEIGPVGDTTHLLRYTAAFALLRRRSPHESR